MKLAIICTPTTYEKIKSSLFQVDTKDVEISKPLNQWNDIIAYFRTGISGMIVSEGHPMAERLKTINMPTLMYASQRDFIERLEAFLGSIRLSVKPIVSASDASMCKDELKINNENKQPTVDGSQTDSYTDQQPKPLCQEQDDEAEKQKKERQESLRIEKEERERKEREEAKRLEEEKQQRKQQLQNQVEKTKQSFSRLKDSLAFSVLGVADSLATKMTKGREKLHDQGEVNASDSKIPVTSQLIALFSPEATGKTYIGVNLAIATAKLLNTPTYFLDATPTCKTKLWFQCPTFPFQLADIPLTVANYDEKYLHQEGVVIVEVNQLEQIPKGAAIFIVSDSDYARQVVLVKSIEGLSVEGLIWNQSNGSESPKSIFNIPVVVEIPFISDTPARIRKGIPHAFDDLVFCQKLLSILTYDRTNHLLLRKEKVSNVRA